MNKHWKKPKEDNLETRAGNIGHKTQNKDKQDKKHSTKKTKKMSNPNPTGNGDKV